MKRFHVHSAQWLARLPLGLDSRRGVGSVTRKGFARFKKKIVKGIHH